VRKRSSAGFRSRSGRIIGRPGSSRAPTRPITKNVGNPQTKTASCTRLRVAVCVITYRRPAGLARLFGALEALRFAEPAPDIRIFVIDNDPMESARDVVRELSGRMETPVVYRTEKRPGIPQARNAALGAAMGWADRIAFVDDDDIPEADWLGELIRVQTETGADAVTGPCPPEFEEPPPAWVVAGRLFETSRCPTGTRRHVAFTGNVLIRKAALAAMGELFDECLAETGGSDSEFFQRFVWSGNSIVWCDTAVVHVQVPASRVRLRWILARAYRTGTTEAYVARKRSPAWIPAARLVAYGCYCIAKGVGRTLLVFVQGRSAAAQGLQTASYGAGQIAGSMGLRYAEYRRVDGN